MRAGWFFLPEVWHACGSISNLLLVMVIGNFEIFPIIMYIHTSDDEKQHAAIVEVVQLYCDFRQVSLCKS